MVTALMSSSASNASCTWSAVTAVPHSTFKGTDSIPCIFEMSANLSPNFPPTTFNILSPLLTRFETAASIAEVPEPVRM